MSVVAAKNMASHVSLPLWVKSYIRLANRAPPRLRQRLRGKHRIFRYALWNKNRRGHSIEWRDGVIAPV